MSDDVKIPSISDLLWPVLQATHALGGSAARAELMEHVRGVAGLTDEQIAVVYSGPTGKSKALHRIEWAIYWLKAMGVLESSRGGVYTTTSDGTEYLRMNDGAAVRLLGKKYEDARKRAGKKAAVKRAAKGTLAGKDRMDPVPGDDWKTVLLATLKKMNPAAFERLAMRLLREAGFQRVEVVGRSGDAGLDGIGLYKMSLVSFPIYFQCKRYAGGVGASAVRDFRGAMAGRGDKGLIITTGTFTLPARAEATKAGAPPVDLIDGDALCDLNRGVQGRSEGDGTHGQGRHGRRDVLRQRLSICGHRPGYGPPSDLLRTELSGFRPRQVFLRHTCRVGRSRRNHPFGKKNVAVAPGHRTPAQSLPSVQPGSRGKPQPEWLYCKRPSWETRQSLTVQVARSCAGAVGLEARFARGPRTSSTTSRPHP